MWSSEVSSTIVRIWTDYYVLVKIKPWELSIIGQKMWVCSRRVENTLISKLQFIIIITFYLNKMIVGKFTKINKRWWW